MQGTVLADSGASRRTRVQLPPIDVDLERYPKEIRDFLALNQMESERFVQDAGKRDAWIAGHYFRPIIDQCIDGRVQDSSEARGLLPGIPEVIRSAGALLHEGSWQYCRRFNDQVARLTDIMVDGRPHPMVAMYTPTVHHSKIEPDMSCAALGNRTDIGLRRMWRKASVMNAAYAPDRKYGVGQRVIAFPITINTDFDSIEVHGPAGSIDTDDLSHVANVMNGKALDFFVNRVQRAFPKTWEPLDQLDEPYRSAFALELAEQLLANVLYVQEVKESLRRLEHIGHHERMIFIGRHCDWFNRWNELFIIDDNDPKRGPALEIALKYVARNSIVRASEEDMDAWWVPISFNIPHNGADRGMTVLHLTAKLKKLQAKIRRSATSIKAYLRGNHGVPEHLRSPALDAQIDDILSHIVICPSVSFKGTRLFEPIAND